MGQGKGPFGRGGPILVGAGVSVVLARRRGKSARFVPDPGLRGTLNPNFPYPSFPLFSFFGWGPGGPPVNGLLATFDLYGCVELLGPVPGLRLIWTTDITSLLRSAPLPFLIPPFSYVSLPFPPPSSYPSPHLHYSHFSPRLRVPWVWWCLGLLSLPGRFPRFCLWSAAC